MRFTHTQEHASLILLDPLLVLAIPSVYCSIVQLTIDRFTSTAVKDFRKLSTNLGVNGI